jgi:hypothetical protein
MAYHRGTDRPDEDEHGVTEGVQHAFADEEAAL